MATSTSSSLPAQVSRRRLSAKHTPEVRRVHGHRLGARLAAFVESLELGRVHLVGAVVRGNRRPPATPSPSTDRDHPRFAGAYAGWTGSLGQAGAEERLRFSERVSGLPPGKFVAAMLPSMFSASASSERVEQFAASVAGSRPAGFLAMARALAEADRTDMLGDIDLPTLLLFGDADDRAPLDVAERLQVAIPGSRLVVMPGVGHVSSVRAPELLNREVRHFFVNTCIGDRPERRCGARWRSSPSGQNAAGDGSVVHTGTEAAGATRDPGPWRHR